MDNSEWTSCPYERSHRVPLSRIQRHLVKCEARHPPLAVCPYNATHRMPEAQLTAHVRACASRPSEPRTRSPAVRPRARPPPPRAHSDDEHWDE